MPNPAMMVNKTIKKAGPSQSNEKEKPMLEIKGKLNVPVNA